MPILAGFKITHRCNLQCIHCPFWKRPVERELDFAAVVRIMRELRRLGVRILIIEGGEPLLWRDGRYSIQDVLVEAGKLFFSSCVTTNGTLPLDLPANTVWVSVDGLKETHDKIRSGSFDRVMENLGKARHSNIYANITINRMNVGEIPELIRFLSPKVRGITIQFHYPYEEDGLITPPEDRKRVLDEIIELKKAGYPVACSFETLRALKRGRWNCHDWMLANVDPDGTINIGCYVKNRGPVACQFCGFAAHTEISLAYDLNLASIMNGWRIFRYNKKVSPDEW